jgi:transcriptional regulator with XRE-family HTH domain
MRFSDSDIKKELKARVERSSVRALARELGVSPAMISQVANGDYPPGPKIAEALGFMDDGLRWVRKAKRK